MPTPDTILIIGVDVTDGREGEWVKVTNFTKGGTIRKQLDATKRATINSKEHGNFDDWDKGDVVQAEIQGRVTSVLKQTITSKSNTRKFILTGAANTKALPIIM